MTSPSTSRVWELNDALRTTSAPLLGDWMLTAGITSGSPNFVASTLEAVQTFDSFTEDNDPYGEHDFGSVIVFGITVFWKIDYYDQTLTAGSEDPADPGKTRRVLTVMLA